MIQQEDVLFGTISISGKPIYITPEPYTGTYEVVPDVYQAQVLDTANKLLSNNVKVYKIPQYETSNPSGGYTLIIGG